MHMMNEVQKVRLMTVVDILRDEKRNVMADAITEAMNAAVVRLGESQHALARTKSFLERESVMNAEVRELNRHALLDLIEGFFTGGPVGAPPKEG